MTGLELLDTGAIAVSLSSEGRIVARGEAFSAGDARDALSALEQAAPSVAGPTGLAAVNPDAPSCADVVRALARKNRGPLPAGPVSSGIAAAAAEAWIGAARGASDVVYFGIGDHALAGILREGRPLAGAHRRAASVGWLALNPVEREDYRKAGCLEAEAAASGIVRRFVWRIKAGDHSERVDAVAGGLRAIAIADVLAAAREGDGVAVSVIRDTIRYLGMAAANLVVIADPEVLVLGGLMAAAPDLLLEPVRTEIARRLPPPMTQALTIVPSTLGADAPAIGAARLAQAVA